MEKIPIFANKLNQSLNMMLEADILAVSESIQSSNTDCKVTVHNCSTANTSCIISSALYTGTIPSFRYCTTEHVPHCMKQLVMSSEIERTHLMKISGIQHR